MYHDISHSVNSVLLSSHSFLPPDRVIADFLQDFAAYPCRPQSPFVCVSVCFFSANKNLKNPSLNLTEDYPKMSPENPFMLGQRSRSHVTKTLPAWVFALL